jgi:hypothetical protein
MVIASAFSCLLSSLTTRIFFHLPLKLIHFTTKLEFVHFNYTCDICQTKKKITCDFYIYLNLFFNSLFFI